MSHHTEYTVQLVSDVLPQRYRHLPPPSELLLLRICFRQRAHFNGSVQESPENVGVFPLLPDILFSEDSAWMILSPCLLNVGIPTHHHERPIDDIISFYREIGTSDGGETPIITANILMETWSWVSNDETEAVARVMQESMELECSAQSQQPNHPLKPSIR
ncbi:unnamed protein product [Ilex paraguariensis]|uniref:Uncharacterized protein n=1 Tax=Ilex paraguariensis TaxID=185542 RepID=A0ABC8SL45_9AQUA